MTKPTISALFANPIFLSALLSLFIAQLAKAVIVLLKARSRQELEKEIKETLVIFLWRTGGMPSSHAAVAVAITTSIAIEEGFSNLFILAFFIALIVIRDALGVRRSSGLQAKTLNRLGQDLSRKLGITYTALKEVHGHTWPEVIAGSILGLGIAFLMSFVIM
ncbi:MAG: divergent PAP2 family protein [Spirochaetia bacterium]|nr:divergent PAP2 family protein [Spirochaetia bacterium]